MEVSGKRTKTKHFSVSRNSEDDFQLHCLPCVREDIQIPAIGYCKDCNEHLCETCYKTHRKSAQCHNYVLLDKDSMPQTLTTPSDDSDTYPDQDDELELYCRDHSSIDKRDCKIVEIPKLSSNSKDELKRMMTELKALEDKCKSKVKSAEESKNNVVKAHAKILADIQTFREEINVRLDEMERQVKEEANSIMNAEQKRLGDVLKTYEDVTKRTKHIALSLETLRKRKQFDHLLIEMKNAKPKYDELVAIESQLQTGNDLQLVRFVKNQTILDLLPVEMGKLVSIGESEKRRSVDRNVPSQDKTVVLEHIESIDVAAKDEKECHITGMAVIPLNKIVFCDSYNSKIKCFNTREKKVEHEVHLDNCPFSLAVIANNKLAVTVPTGKCIYIISLVDRLIAIDYRLYIDEECRGIAFCQDKLLVSCNPGKVIIINLSGKLLKTFSEDLFTSPVSIAVDREERYIYLIGSGHGKSAVYKLDWQGVVASSSTEEWHEDQEGLQELEDGTFLVCLQSKNNNIVRMSSSCMACKITVLEKSGHYYPSALCYSKEKRTLYVSYSNKHFGASGFIKVFNVAWSTN